MKPYIFQIILGILLTVSAYSLSQAAGTLDRIEKRVDRLEVKVDGHVQNFTIHQTK